jgi:hypothetical protein
MRNGIPIARKSALAVVVVCLQPRDLLLQNAVDSLSHRWQVSVVGAT